MRECFFFGNEWENLCDAINYESNEENLKIIFGRVYAIKFNDSG